MNFHVRRKIQGESKAFEDRVKRDVNNEPDCFLIKIPENVRVIKGKIIRAKTECDMIGMIGSSTMVFDCKERIKDKFYIKEVCLGKSSCHQYFYMKSCVDKSVDNLYAGYLCHFKSLKIIAWISIQEIVEAQKNGSTVIDPLKCSNQPFNQRIDIKKLLGVTLDQ